MKTENKLDPKKNLKKTKTAPEITDKVKINFEPNVHDLFIGMDEEFDKIASGESLDLNEILTIGQRIKRRQQMRRYKTRLQIARKRKLSRRANNATINRRARRGALAQVKKRLSGGRSPSQLTYADRARVEKLAARRKALVSRKARRLVIKKRQLDRQRISNRSRRH